MGYFDFECEGCGNDSNTFTKNKAFVKTFYMNNKYCDGFSICECNNTKYSSIYDINKIKECKLYKTLKQYDDIHNTKFHCMKYNFLGTFNGNINWRMENGKHTISIYSVYCELCFHKLNINNNYINYTECTKCMENIKSSYAYTYDFTIKKSTTDEDKSCDGYSYCVCNVEYIEEDDKIINNNDKIDKQNDNFIFYNEIINGKYVDHLRNEILSNKEFNEKRVKKCKLYKFLQRINDPNNLKYHKMNFCSPNLFYECISDNYKVYPSCILCEECYNKHTLK
jgi:hypothetical protein